MSKTSIKHNPTVYRGQKLAVAVDPADDFTLEISAGAVGRVVKQGKDYCDVAFPIAMGISVVVHKIKESDLAHLQQLATP
jgi:hypothetical protein